MLCLGLFVASNSHLGEQHLLNVSGQKLFIALGL